MHIPDGLMDPVVWIAGYLIAVPVLVLAFRKLGKEAGDERIPFMAVLAAGIFAAQMLNFPVAGGTTGHLIGAALATILVGPAAAMAILTVVILIQCLFFGDGGVTAFGLNLLNMAIVAPLVAWITFKSFRGKARIGAIFTAAWLSVFVAAFIAATELSISFWLSGGAYGIAPLVSIPAMLGYHALIGVGEGIITVGILTFVSHVAPEITKAGKASVEEAPQ
jgi:cobalt/nickel transport system permease protein